MLNGALIGSILTGALLITELVSITLALQTDEKIASVNKKANVLTKIIELLFISTAPLFCIKEFISCFENNSS